MVLCTWAAGGLPDIPDGLIAAQRRGGERGAKRPRTRPFWTLVRAYVLVVLVVAELDTTETVGADDDTWPMYEQRERRCVGDADCRDGEFCGLQNCDSYEGWQHTCSYCLPCSRCACDRDAVPGSCPTARCPGTPAGRVGDFEGAFYSVAAPEPWSGDVCVTSLVVRSATFRQVSFRMTRDNYARAIESLPKTTVTNGRASLCDFPDSPGPREGLAFKRERTQADLQTGVILRVELVYYVGLALGSSRFLVLRDRCPGAIEAEFLPFEFVSSRFRTDAAPLIAEAGLYTYSTAREGYVRDGPNAHAVEAIRVELEVVSDGQPQDFKAGLHMGELAYGSQRTNLSDWGVVPSVRCNVAFVLETALSGLTPFDQHIFDCRLHVPEMYVSRQNRHEQQKSAIRSQRGSAGEPSTGSHAAGVGIDQQQETSWEDAQTDQKGNPRELSARKLLQDTEKPTAGCQPGTMDDYRYTPAQLAILEQEYRARGERPPNWLREFPCLAQPNGCCVSCLAGKYSFEIGSKACLSCPPGLTTGRDGAQSLAECCKLVDDIGIYNSAHAGITKGYVSVGRDQVTSLAQDCTIPIEYRHPRTGVLLRMSCFEATERLSTTPTVMKDAGGVRLTDVGTSGPFCTDVRLDIQPRVTTSDEFQSSTRAVASVLVLDFECGGRILEKEGVTLDEYPCSFDLGYGGSMNISFYVVSASTELSEEIKTQETALPSQYQAYGPKPRENPRATDADFPVHMLSFSNDFAFVPPSELSSENSTTPLPQTTPVPPNFDKPSNRRLQRIIFNPSIPLQQWLKEYSAEIEAQQSQYACAYEDTNMGSQMINGIVYPKRHVGDVSCITDFESRLAILNKLKYNPYTRHLRDEEFMDAGARGWRWSDGPVKIGARISAKLGQYGEFYPTPPSFTIGTSFISAAAACTPGTFSMTGGQPCEACEPGKFAPTDGALFCMDCPRGTYSNNTGSFFCKACDIGQSTINRSSSSATSCMSYCHAGSFSKTGLEPCQLCPQNFHTSKIGSRFCEKCPEGFLTAGQSPTGFATGLGSTNIEPDICYDGRDLFLGFEEVWAVTRNLMMRVTWKVPDLESSVNDIIAVFKGAGMGPDMSSRQMAWMYASAQEAHGMDLVCSWSNEGCQTQGVEPKPWGAVTFQVDSGGPGLYSAVYYSMRRNMRLISASWSCHDFQLKGSNGQLMPCPYDSGLWVQHSGLFICPPGHYSPTGSYPCMRCPPGHVASEHNSTFCTPCPLKSYTGFTDGTIDDQSNIECLVCPTGKLSLVTGSTYEDCLDCCPGVTTAQPTTTFLGTTPKPVVCGDGELADSEDCDDGNDVKRDGCSEDCRIERYFKCEGMRYGQRVQRLDPASKTPDRCYKECGDGIADVPLGQTWLNPSQCDDGNTVNGDGCDQACFVEPGWKCESKLGQLSVCELLPVCGNKVREWEKGEECDDGNLGNGDGCSDACFVEPFHTCTNFTYYRSDLCCALPNLCGNGLVNACEECDDGNIKDNDGCSGKCESEQLSACKDGCSGPLCEVEELQCTSSLVQRRKKQLHSSDLAIRVFNLGAVQKVWPQSKDGYDYELVISETGQYPGGDRLVGYSAGLLLDKMQGPQGTGEMLVLMGLTGNGITGGMPDTEENLVFRSLYAHDNSASPFACPYCDEGMRFLHYPSGSVSELSGMYPRDRTCIFRITGGNAFKILQHKARGIVLTIQYNNFEDPNEYLSLHSLGFKTRTYFIGKNDGLTYPLELHLVPEIQMTVALKSNLYAGLDWQLPSGGFRFKLSYKTILLGEQSTECVNAKCNRDPDCILRESCFAIDSNMEPVNAAEYEVDTNSYGFRRRNINADNLPGETPGALKELTQRDIAWKNSSSADEVTLHRRSSARSQHGILNLAINSDSGIQHSLPCFFGQDDKHTIIRLERQDKMWSEIAGAWQGTCLMLPSCLYAKVGAACIPDYRYNFEMNSCSVLLHVDHNILREFRYNCEGKVGPAGSAHGLLQVYSDQVFELGTQLTGPALRYFRMKVTWLRSTLPDRPSDTTSLGYITFGRFSTYDPTIDQSFQILLQEPGSLEFPVINVDYIETRFKMRPGGCQRIELTSTLDPDFVVRTEPIDKSASYLPEILDLQKYMSCNMTVLEIYKLADQSSDCEKVVNRFLLREADSIMHEIPGDDELCDNPCFGLFKEKLKKGALNCAESFRSSHNTMKYLSQIYKKLYILVTALTWTDLWCTRNHHGDACRRSIANYAHIFEDCPNFRSPIPQFAPPFKLEIGRDSCPKTCLDALVKYQEKEGCCAATIAEMSVRWGTFLSTLEVESTQAIQWRKGLPFQFDSGITQNPWTPLGTLQESFGLFWDHCSPTYKRLAELDAKIPGTSSHFWEARHSYPACMISTHCDSFNWRPTCCTFKCENGGYRRYPGDCFCHCIRESGFVGRGCNERSDHVRFEMILNGESEVTFTEDKKRWTIMAIKNLLFVKIEHVEIDTIMDAATNRRHTLSTSLSVTLRIIVRNSREGQLIGKNLAQCMENGRLAEEIRNQSTILPSGRTDGSPWIPNIGPGVYPPVTWDQWGMEACVHVPCVFSNAEEVIYETKNTTTDALQLSRPLLIAMSASFASLIVMMIGCACCVHHSNKWRHELSMAEGRLVGTLESGFGSGTRLKFVAPSFKPHDNLKVSSPHFAVDAMEKRECIQDVKEGVKFLSESENSGIKRVNMTGRLSAVKSNPRFFDSLTAGKNVDTWVGADLVYGGDEGRTQRQEPKEVSARVLSLRAKLLEARQRGDKQDPPDSLEHPTMLEDRNRSRVHSMFERCKTPQYSYQWRKEIAAATTQDQAGAVVSGTPARTMFTFEHDEPGIAGCTPKNVQEGLLDLSYHAAQMSGHLKYAQSLSKNRASSNQVLGSERRHIDVSSVRVHRHDTQDLKLLLEAQEGDGRFRNLDLASCGVKKGPVVLAPSHPQAERSYDSAVAVAEATKTSALLGSKQRGSSKREVERHQSLRNLTDRHLVSSRQYANKQKPKIGDVL